MKVHLRQLKVIDAVQVQPSSPGLALKHIRSTGSEQRTLQPSCEASLRKPDFPSEEWLVGKLQLFISESSEITFSEK